MMMMMVVSRDTRLVIFCYFMIHKPRRCPWVAEADQATKMCITLAAAVMGAWAALGIWSWGGQLGAKTRAQAQVAQYIFSPFFQLLCAWRKCSGVQRQSPWSVSQGDETSLKLKHFKLLDVQWNSMETAKKSQIYCVVLQKITFNKSHFSMCMDTWGHFITINFFWGS